MQKMDLRDCLQKGDIILALVGHKAFAAVDPDTIAQKTVIDVCGLWRAKQATRHGYEADENDL